MKIEKCSSTNVNSAIVVPKKYVGHPNFKSGGGLGAINFVGGIMQRIQNGGFLVSFLIQDCIGMTFPRVSAAFLRDKDITGHYNIQEGFEVLGREGMTGPCMMAVAPIMFAIAAKFCHSSSVNSKLIKRVGNSLKEFVKKSEFNKNLLKDKNAFKNEFYKDNIRNILSNTIGKENVKDESIEYILKELKKYETIPDKIKKLSRKERKKYKSGCMSNIIEHINNLKYKTSQDLDMLGRVKYGSSIDQNIKSFDTNEVFDAIIKYSDDAISLNKNLDKLDEAYAEQFKNKTIGKRVLTNITTLFTTLGVLSVLPKIYARSDVSPAARTLMQMKEKEQQTANSEKLADNNSQEPSFKAKMPKKSFLEKLGKLVSKNNDKFAGEFEYKGHNFTNTLMTCLSGFGLLLPRGARAYNRAQVDENGKKDLSEIYEILIRDLTSTLSVIFAVPMLTRACVSSYEKKTGFVLLQKDRSRTGFKKFVDLINPYSNSHVLNNKEIASLYDKIDSHEKMLNFCEFINKNEGDLEKIISKSDKGDKLIKGIDFAKKSRTEKNKQIIDHIKDLVKNNNKKDVDKLITEVMKGSSSKMNKIFCLARGLNSVPALIMTFLVSPYILGWFIPRLTYAHTRKMHEKAELERKSKLNAAV